MENGKEARDEKETKRKRMEEIFTAKPAANINMVCQQLEVCSHSHSHSTHIKSLFFYHVLFPRCFRFSFRTANPQQIHLNDAIIGVGAVENVTICLVTHKKWMEIK